MTKIVRLPERFTVFKVIGDESGLLEYTARHPPRASDWAGTYLQFSTDNALGTAFYRIDQGYDVARLMAVELAADEGARALLVGDEWFGAGDASGEAKAQAVRAWLRANDDESGGGGGGAVDDTKPLVAQLGERGLVLLCRESADEWELVVPSAMLLSGALVRIADERVAAELLLDRVRCQVTNMAAAEASVERQTTPTWLLDAAQP